MEGQNSTKGLKLMSVAGIFTLLLAIVTLVGIAVVDQMGEQLRDPTAVTNESVTATNATGVSLANTYVLSSYTFTAYNNSGNTNVVPTTAYSVDYTNGKITNIRSGTYGTGWYVSYTYGASNTVVTTAALFVAGLVVFGTFMSLITLVLVGKIIIQLIKGND